MAGDAPSARLSELIGRLREVRCGKRAGTELAFSKVNALSFLSLGEGGAASCPALQFGGLCFLASGLPE